LWHGRGDEAAGNCAPQVMEEAARTLRFLRGGRTTLAKLFDKFAIVPVKNWFAELRGSCRVRWCNDGSVRSDDPSRAAASRARFVRRGLGASRRLPSPAASGAVGKLSGREGY
jgi:hypothetical protein